MWKVFQLHACTRTTRQYVRFFCWFLTFSVKWDFWCFRSDCWMSDLSHVSAHLQIVAVKKNVAYINSFKAVLMLRTNNPWAHEHTVVSGMLVSVCLWRTKGAVLEKLWDQSQSGRNKYPSSQHLGSILIATLTISQHPVRKGISVSPWQPPI